MSEVELNDMIKFQSLSWNSKFKWFGTYDFVTNRVQDRKFNNSRFKQDKYSNLVEFEFDDSSTPYFDKVGNKEWMLSRKKAPMVKYKFQVKGEICNG